MIARTSRVFLEVVAATLIGLVLLAAVAAWRLSQGPLSLTFLTPFLEEALNAGKAPVTIRLSDTILTWSGWERTLEIRTLGARALAGDGWVVATVPEISLSLSVRALLQGVVAPTRLELIRPRVRLVRTRAGGIELALGESGTLSGDVVREIGVKLLRPPDSDRTLGYLTRISIVGAEVTIDDRVSGTRWGAPRADMVLYRDAQTLRGGIDIEVEMDGHTSAVEATVFHRIGETGIKVEATFSELRPDLIAVKLAQFELPGVKPLAALRIPIRGRASLEFGLDGNLRAGSFDLAGADGRLTMPEYWPDGLAIRSLSVRGRMQQKPDLVLLDDIKFDLGGPTLTANAVITRTGAAAAINGEAVLRDLPIAEFDRYWPHGVGTSARDWVIANMTEGKVDETRVEISLRTGARAGGGLTVQSLTGTLRLSGAAIHFLKPLPPVRDVAATAEFSRDRILFTLKGGGLQGLSIDGGKLDFSRLNTDAEHADVEVVVRGPLRSALNILDHPYLKYISGMGLDPANAGGAAAARLVFRFPLRRTLKTSEVKAAAAANLRNVTIADAVKGQALTAGTLTLKVDTTGLDISGSAKLGPVPVKLKWFENFAGTARYRRRYEVTASLDEAQRATLGLDLAPYLRGTVPVKLVLLEDGRGEGRLAVKVELKGAAMALPLFGWTKPAGKDGIVWLNFLIREGRVRELSEFSLRTTDLEAGGKAVFSFVGGPFRLDLRTFKLGATHVSGSIARDKAGRYRIELKGPGFDVAPLLRFDDDAGATMPPMSIKADLGRVWFSTGLPVDKVVGSLDYDGEIWRNFELAGVIEKKHRLRLRMRREAKFRRLDLRSTDGGALLRTLGLIETVRGGKLRLTASRLNSPSGSPWKGSLVISDFRVVDAPLLARVLAVASFPGIVDTLSGKGIGFARLEMPYALHGKILKLEKARSVGSALGLTASGEVDLVKDTLKLNGTIIPAYTINSVFGKIPILGELLTGSEGGGVFAATYRVEGTLDKPKITVNPLAALAPGVLRDLLGVITSGAAVPATDNDLFLNED
jgi:hypothetical protein